MSINVVWTRALLLILACASLSTQAKDDVRCADLSGAAYGLCTAAVSIPCEGGDPKVEGCSKIAESFRKITGEEPPWLALQCSTNQDCAYTHYCAKPVGACADKGVCVERRPPDGSCPAIFEPVCGCDGITYANDCEAARSGVSVATEGECPIEPSD